MDIPSGPPPCVVNSLFGLRSSDLSAHSHQHIFLLNNFLKQNTDARSKTSITLPCPLRRPLPGAREESQTSTEPNHREISEILTHEHAEQQTRKERAFYWTTPTKWKAGETCGDTRMFSPSTTTKHDNLRMMRA
jgi:hypothetical protein